MNTVSTAATTSSCLGQEWGETVADNHMIGHQNTGLDRQPDPTGLFLCSWNVQFDFFTHSLWKSHMYGYQLDTCYSCCLQYRSGPWLKPHQIMAEEDLVVVPLCILLCLPQVLFNSIPFSLVQSREWEIEWLVHHQISGATIQHAASGASPGWALTKDITSYASFPLQAYHITFPITSQPLTI